MPWSFPIFIVGIEFSWVLIFIDVGLPLWLMGVPLCIVILSSSLLLLRLLPILRLWAILRCYFLNYCSISWQIPLTLFLSFSLFCLYPLFQCCFNGFLSSYLCRVALRYRESSLRGVCLLHPSVFSSRRWWASTLRLEWDYQILSSLSRAPCNFLCAVDSIFVLVVCPGEDVGLWNGLKGKNPVALKASLTLASGKVVWFITNSLLNRGYLSFKSQTTSLQTPDFAFFKVDVRPVHLQGVRYTQWCLLDKDFQSLVYSF